MSKPRIAAASAPLLAKIDAYIRQYNLRGTAIYSAASDVLDGLAIRREVDDLVRRRLLGIVPYEHDHNGDGYLCGQTWSVILTDRAISIFWPQRAAGVKTCDRCQGTGWWTPPNGITEPCCERPTQEQQSPHEAGSDALDGGTAFQQRPVSGRIDFPASTRTPSGLFRDGEIVAPDGSGVKGLGDGL